MSPLQQQDTSSAPTQAQPEVQAPPRPPAYVGQSLEDIIRDFVLVRGDLEMPYAREQLAQAVLSSAEVQALVCASTVGQLRVTDFGSRIVIAGQDHGALLGLGHAGSGQVSLRTDWSYRLAEEHGVALEYASLIMEADTPCRVYPLP